MEFLKGEIESVPLPDASVDVIISNCVINLSTDKDRVLAEAFRVLRPGGRFAVSDVALPGRHEPGAGELLRDVEAWSGCIAGALEEQDYLARLRRPASSTPTVEVTNVYDGAPENTVRRAAAARRRAPRQRVRARRQAGGLTRKNGSARISARRRPREGRRTISRLRVSRRGGSAHGR